MERTVWSGYKISRGWCFDDSVALCALDHREREREREGKTAIESKETENEQETATKALPNMEVTYTTYIPLLYCYYIPGTPIDLGPGCAAWLWTVV